jgi:DNA-binding GntR family transcriptional regulator
MNIEPLTPATMPDAIARSLRAAILDGRLVPGEQLREAHLASRFAISRGPLREALRRLEEEGLLVKVPYRGAFVAGADPRATAEIATIRLRLEPYAVELGLERLCGPDHAQLVDAVADLDDAALTGDVGRCIDAHLAVHRVLYTATGNRRLLDIWHSWETLLRLSLAVDHRAFGRLSDVAALHRTLLRTIETGDLDLISRELDGHIRAAIVADTGPAIPPEDGPDRTAGSRRPSLDDPVTRRPSGTTDVTVLKEA